MLYEYYIDTYGSILTEEYILEFDFGTTVEQIKKNIKKFLYNIINKAEHLVRKMKNSRLKSALLDIITKAKDMLNKCNQLEKDGEANNFRNSAQELGIKLFKIERFWHYIDEDGNVERTYIANDCAYQTLSKLDINELFEQPEVKRVCIGSFNRWKEEQKKKGRPIDNKDKWDKKYLDIILCASVAEVFDKDYCLYLYDVSVYVNGIK